MWETLLEMERTDYRASEKDSGAITLVLDSARATGNTEEEGMKQKQAMKTTTDIVRKNQSKDRMDEHSS